MSTIIVTVTGAQLQWARKYRRHTIKQAARLLGISDDELAKYESGAELPNLGLIRKMSNKYSLPIATLVLPSPPKFIPKDPENFRTFVGKPPELSSGTLAIISRIRMYQNVLAELQIIDQKFEAPEINEYRMMGDAAKLGEDERLRLGIDVRDQLKWADPEEAFRTWRRVIERQGVYVYVEKYDLEDCWGISLLDYPKLPAIIINKNVGLPVATIFSLIHEYAHIILRKPGLSDMNDRNPVERFCNQFAAGFLIPRIALGMIIAPWPSKPVEWEQGEIKEFARRLHVSQQAMALRLEELKLAPPGFYNRFKEKQPKDAIKKKEYTERPPAYATLRIYALGRRFPTAIISASDRGLISPVDAAIILNVPEHKFKDMRARLEIRS